MNGICEKHNIQFLKEHGGCPLCLTERIAKLEAQVARLALGLREHGHHDIVQDACHPFPTHDPQLCALCRAYPEAAIKTRENRISVHTDPPQFTGI